MHLQSLDSKATLTVVSPTIHLPVSVLAFFVLVTVKILGSLFSCMGVGRCPKAPLGGTLAFFLMMLNGVYILVMYQEKIDSFCH